MTVPASWEGSMYIEDRWREEGVLGGAASSIGDSNLGWAGSSLKQDDCLKEEEDQSFLWHTSCVKPQQIQKVTLHILMVDLTYFIQLYL